MIHCHYGADNRFIDVKNTVLAKFRKNNNICLPKGNKYFNDIFYDNFPGTVKSLMIHVSNGDDNNTYVISESDTDEYTIIIPIYCEYGGDQSFINVTNNILVRFAMGNNLILHSGDKRFNTYIGDPCPGIEKMLRIYIEDKSYSIPECDTDKHIINIPIEIRKHVMDINKILNDKNIITFVIPTINRPSLIDTLESLICQVDKGWKAICVFDRIEPSEDIKLKLESDSRFSYVILTNKLGLNKNSAGLVRNVGIEQVMTEWVGFVDDDDVLSPYYIHCLKDELINSLTVDCVIFRMIYTHIMPLPRDTDFHRNFVGISFCYKTELFHQGFQFIPSSGEDYDLLNRFRDEGIKMIISSHITYKVRDYDIHPNMNMAEKYCMRAIIN